MKNAGDNVIARIARHLSDGALVANLNRHQHDLDVWETMVGADHPELRRARAVVAALRAEYRQRTGEVI
jgi:hypothetical protein